MVTEAQPFVAPARVFVRECLPAVYDVWKVAFDRPVALLSLVLLSPVIAVVAALVRITSPGPAIFRQNRVGRYGDELRIYKFRTMREDAEEVLRDDPELFAKYVGNNYKLPEGQDPRVTRVGRILRKTSLDELPQLLNVLKGEMSLVGPRPIVPLEIREYGSRASELLSVLPGMTGEWQVSGRSAVDYPERVDVELGYVRGFSPFYDLKLMARTVTAVLARTGAH